MPWTNTPEPTHDNGDWRHRAACRDADPELFFPIGDAGLAVLQVKEAKDVCRRCPVVRECLEFALEQAPFGVWGGLSEEERRQLRRRRRGVLAASTSDTEGAGR